MHRRKNSGTGDLLSFLDCWLLEIGVSAYGVVSTSPQWRPVWNLRLHCVCTGALACLSALGYICRGLAFASQHPCGRWFTTTCKYRSPELLPSLASMSTCICMHMHVDKRVHIRKSKSLEKTLSVHTLYTHLPDVRFLNIHVYCECICSICVYI